MAKANRILPKVNLRHKLLKHMTKNVVELDASTQYPNTLEETKRLDRGGLTHITDKAYEFFNMLEQKRLPKFTM